MTKKEIDNCPLGKPIEPNTKYGYDHPVTLCLRGISNYAGIKFGKPINVNLIGAKISTDENANITLEGWDEAEYLDKDGKIIGFVDTEMKASLTKEYENEYSIEDYLESKNKKVLYEIFFSEGEIDNENN